MFNRVCDRNYMNEITAYTDMELDHLTSWLSTLGGGYSALGDSMDKCVRSASSEASSRSTGSHF